MFKTFGTFKHGEVKKTNGQQKKHYSQMTELEIKILNSSLKNVDLKKMIILPHLINKMSSGDMNFNGEQVARLLLDYQILEYNNTNGNGRVLIRGNKEEDVFVNDRIEKSNLCFVIDVSKNLLVTAYWNSSKDNHDKVNMNRYNKDLEITF